MSRPLPSLAVVLAFACAPLPLASAQLAGSRAGAEGDVAPLADLPLLERETAESYIAIDGRAEVRIPATEIRIVMAVTSEGDTAQSCQQVIQERIERLKEAWSAIGVPGESIVVDFIAVLPRYEWKLEQQSGVDVGIETQVGYRMQTNIHLAVSNEAEVPLAMAAAFEQNVTDIIAFDYWNRDLDETKVQARQKAVEAARDKADVLLEIVFDERPRAINVQEETTVRYPESLYQSFTSTYAEGVTPPFRRDIPFLRAARPRNTYYRGLYPNADVQPSDMPMKPEISVVSTVRLYYESPAATRAKEKQETETGE